MKIHSLWLLPAIIAAFYLGKSIQPADRSSSMSSAGQTLADLARALEMENHRTGSYPDSLTKLQVQPSSAEFSEDVLKRVCYYRTQDSYIAFVGCPSVAFIQPDISPHFK